MRSLVVQKILQTHKITDYLRSKGIHPDGPARGGKLFYQCPLHEGDNTPSFVVYLDSADFENFYCYGCKAKYHIVHLYKALEKISWEAAIKALSNGMKIDDEAEYAHAEQEIVSDTSLPAQYTPDDLILLTGRQLYEFLKAVEHDPEYAQSVDKIFKHIDKAAADCDWNSLQVIFDKVPDALVAKLQEYAQKKDKLELMK